PHRRTPQELVHGVEADGLPEEADGRAVHTAAGLRTAVALDLTSMAVAQRRQTRAPAEAAATGGGLSGVHLGSHVQVPRPASPRDSPVALKAANLSLIFSPGKESLRCKGTGASPAAPASRAAARLPAVPAGRCWRGSRRDWRPPTWTS